MQHKEQKLIPGSQPSVPMAISHQPRLLKNRSDNLVRASREDINFIGVNIAIPGDPLAGLTISDTFRYQLRRQTVGASYAAEQMLAGQISDGELDALQDFYRSASLALGGMTGGSSIEVLDDALAGLDVGRLSVLAANRGNIGNRIRSQDLFAPMDANVRVQNQFTVLDYTDDSQPVSFVVEGSSAGGILTANFDAGEALNGSNLRMQAAARVLNVPGVTAGQLLANGQYTYLVSFTGIPLEDADGNRIDTVTGNLRIAD